MIIEYAIIALVCIFTGFFLMRNEVNENPFAQIETEDVLMIIFMGLLWPITFVGVIGMFVADTYYWLKNRELPTEESKDADGTTETSD
jgi:hypothetical protein